MVITCTLKVTILNSLTYHETSVYDSIFLLRRCVFDLDQYRSHDCIHNRKSEVDSVDHTQDSMWVHLVEGDKTEVAVGEVVEEAVDNKVFDSLLPITQKNKDEKRL